jgi:hypothetical protein
MVQPMQALPAAVLVGEHTLFVPAGTWTVAVDRILEEPSRPAQLIKLRQRTVAVQEEQNGCHRLGEIVADG